MRGKGADGFVVAMKPGNAGGAKGPAFSAEDASQPVNGMNSSLTHSRKTEEDEPDASRDARPVL